MPVFAALYDYDPARDADRKALLDEHRAWLAALRQDGRLVEAGVLVEEPGAVLALTAADLDDATAAFDADPFHRADLVARRRIAEWRATWGVVAAAAAASDPAASTDGVVR
jgi:uncharacterized protein